jgi:hypothetical protein
LRASDELDEQIRVDRNFINPAANRSLTSMTHEEWLEVAVRVGASEH